jgi:predicted RNA-binding Zn-ribbon protein involved in translation (DUF1610 family)
MSGEPGADEPPKGAPPEAAPGRPEAPGPKVTCPGCGSVFDRRYLAETCRYEPGQGYRCANCNHILEREAAGE